MADNDWFSIKIYEIFGEFQNTQGIANSGNLSNFQAKEQTFVAFIQFL